tara:strand:+ start:92 stop:817 length:726 start_codon:yes stop_codon:yes gene_type:complete
MPVKLNKNKALNHYFNEGGDTSFPNSLNQVLDFIQEDNNLNKTEEVAYLLATAKSESDYQLTRWESDYLCGDKGVPYDTEPCQAALDYYRSTEGGGKSNYYNKGVDRFGVPYFGRGLIQLTNDYNYEKYGDLIGEDLLRDGDLALKPQNSYNIASIYMFEKGVFDAVQRGDMTSARQRVNGGTKGVERTNQEYERWLKVLNKPDVNFKEKIWTKKKRIVVGVIILSFVIGGAFALYDTIKK